MHFKQIELTGFKSFADRTIIDLEDGMTAVVGPNGCGKSNILDAMRWALGEQKPKTLRGAHMQDIIFNGSDERAAMGMAEVSMTFDNADGMLPVDFAEVQITRRLYRSGESDYLINKAPCRLRDVQELFMDTGIGTNAYSMIGQGKIGMVLSSKAEDRRFLFEEAAGIIKYKSRKRIAMRKMDQAEQNQLRLGDIIGEVQRQMRSLKRQVNAAIRHRELTTLLRELEIRASWLKQRELLGKIEILRAQFAEASDTYENKTSEMSQLEARHEELSLSKLEVDRQLHARREAVHEIDTEMEKIEGRVALIRQQIEFSIEQGVKAAEEKTALSERAETIQEDEQQAAAKAAALREERSNAESALESHQLRLEQAAQEVTTADAQLEACRAKSVELMTRKAEIQTDIETLSVSIQNIEEQLASLEQRGAAESARRESLAELIREQQEVDSAMATELSELRDEMERASEEQARVEAAHESETKRGQELREQSSSVEARLVSLRELRASYEGFAAGAKAVMQAKTQERPEAEGVLGPVGDLIQTGDRYERAVEAALGGHLSSIVIEHAEQAKGAIHFLREGRRGRVTFLPLDSLHAHVGPQPVPLSGYPGVISRLMDVVQIDERIRPVALHLLHDTVLVETLDDALRIAQSVRPCPRLATLSGEIVEATGAISGGESGGDARGLLGRGNEIAELETRVETLNRALEESAQNLAALTDERSAAADLAKQLNTQASERQAARAEAGHRMSQLVAENQTLIESGEAAALERDSHEAKRAERIDRRQSRRDTATAMVEEGESHEAELERTRTAAATTRESQGQLAHELSDLRVQSAQLLKSIDETDRDRARHQQDLDHARSEMEKQTQAIAEFGEQRTVLETEREKHLTRSKELATSREDGQKLVVDTVNQRQGLLDESEALETTLKTVREEAQETQSVVHKTEIDLRHDEDQLQFFQERIASEYGVALGSLTEEEVGADEHDEKERDRVVADTRERLDRIGTVNLMAIEEFEALTERHEFLTTQERDLQDAREALMTVVGRIDNTIREMFLETFNAVAENFRDYFRRLFSGGQARVYLIDEDDPLESGIEIEARPPGKKPQSISLLSGGEQALTAIALLFGIFKAKPSPFCVLDEVDAPLDDANIGRFIELVAEFTAETQFVVITHNKQTMACAGALYGVTQQERGVSQIVSVSFDDGRQGESAA